VRGVVGVTHHLLLVLAHRCVPSCVGGVSSGEEARTLRTPGGVKVIEAKGTSGLVKFDGTTVVISRTGLIQRSVSQGLHGEHRYPVRQLTGARIQKPGMHAGQFTLLAPGARDVGFRKASGGGDPMTVLFQRKALKAFEEMAAAINDAIARGTSPQPYPAAPVDGIAGQLAQLAALHAAGQLTDEQFEAAKASVLGQGHYAPGPQDAPPWTGQYAV
jgi:hypothetical protein